MPMRPYGSEDVWRDEALDENKGKARARNKRETQEQAEEWDRHEYEEFFCQCSCCRRACSCCD
jgi:hypothetical protein